MRTFYMVLFFVFLGMTLLAVRAQKRQPAGKTLIVFKTSSTAKFLKYTVGVVFILYMFSFVYQFFIGGKNTSENIFQALFWMSWAFFMFITQGRKALASEKGISYMGNFYPWNSIKTWSWSKKQDSILVNAKSINRAFVPLSFNLKVDKVDYDKANEIFVKYSGKPKYK